MRQLRPGPTIPAAVHRNRIAVMEQMLADSERALVNLIALLPFAMPRHDGHRLHSPTLPMIVVPRQRRPSKRVRDELPPPEQWPVRKGIRVPPSMHQLRREGRT